MEGGGDDDTSRTTSHMDYCLVCMSCVVLWVSFSPGWSVSCALIRSVLRATTHLYRYLICQLEISCDGNQETTFVARRSSGSRGGDGTYEEEITDTVYLSVCNVPTSQPAKKKAIRARSMSI